MYRQLFRIVPESIMGRSFLSIRQAVNIMAERWARVSRILSRDDKAYARTTADLAKVHASEAFFGCDYPLEGAVFSVMVELGKRARKDWRETNENGRETGARPRDE